MMGEVVGDGEKGGVMPRKQPEASVSLASKARVRKRRLHVSIRHEFRVCIWDGGLLVVELEEVSGGGESNACL